MDYKFTPIGCTAFREELIAVGFKVYEDRFTKEGNMCNWYAVRRTVLDAQECECNEGKSIQLVVTPYHYSFREDCVGVDVDIIGEAGGVWYKLQAYSLKQEELLEKLPTIEESLVSAWNALSRGTE